MCGCAVCVNACVRDVTGGACVWEEAKQFSCNHSSSP